MFLAVVVLHQVEVHMPAAWLAHLAHLAVDPYLAEFSREDGVDCVDQLGHALSRVGDVVDRHIGGVFGGVGEVGHE